MTEDILEKLASGGWGALENNAKGFEQDLKKQQQLDLERAAIIAAPFRTPEGKRCLEELVRLTIFRPLVPLGGPRTAEDVAIYAAQRQGQNNMVALILNAVAAGDGRPAIERSEH